MKIVLYCLYIAENTGIIRKKYMIFNRESLTERVRLWKGLAVALVSEPA